MRQPRNNGVGSFGARGSAPPIWQRRSVHLLVGASIVIIGLLAMFGTTEHAGAQEVVPDSVRITLTAEEGTTCRGVAVTFTGSETQCGSLVAENSFLEVSGGAEISVGDQLVIPPLWNQRVIDLDGAGYQYSKQVIDPAPVPVGDVINNGYGLDVLGITIGLSIAFGILLGVLGLLLWLNAPGVADLRQRILQAMTKHKPQPT